MNSNKETKEKEEEEYDFNIHNIPLECNMNYEDKHFSVNRYETESVIND